MYAPLLIVALGAMMARLLVAAHVLGVAEFARFSAVLLVSSSFCMLGALGLQTMLQRDLPAFVHRGQERRGVVLLFQALLVSAACAVVGLAVAAAWPSGSGDRAIDGLALALGMLHGASQQSFLLVTVESRSRGATMSFGRQYLGRSLLVVACGYAAMRFAGSGAAAAAAEAVATLVVVVGVLRGIAVRSRCGIRMSVGLAVRRLRVLPWRPALALLAVFSLTWLVHNVDRWVAEARLGVSEFAGYAFAGTVLSASSSLQMVVSASLFPRLATEHARSGRRSAFRLAMRFSAALAAVGLVALPVAVIAWRLFVEGVFPHYAWTLPAAPIVVAVGVIRVADYWSGYLLVVGAERQLLAVTVLSAPAAAGAWWWWSSASGGGATVVVIAWLALAMAVVPGAAGLWLAWRTARP